MAYPTELATAIAVYAPLLITLMFAGDSIARELRPSDHGLEFQNLPPAGLNSYPPDMMTFFNGKHSTSPTTDFALPKAMNSSDSSPSSWWRSTGGGDSGGRDHVRDALMVGSFVCGITGGVLLLASGLLYLFKYRKQKLNKSSSASEHEDQNKLQLVPRNPWIH